MPVKIIKLMLTVLLFICLVNMPYGYYEFIRYISMIAFAYLSFASYKEKNLFYALIFIALALLFQPLIKIALGRTIWNIVDVIVVLNQGLEFGVEWL